MENTNITTAKDSTKETPKVLATASCSILKRFGTDFDSPGGALTLSSEEVSETSESGTHTRTHDSGWTITGQIFEDYYVWVNDFKAHHPEYGILHGNFEDDIYCESEEAFAHFWVNHEPLAWDYHDI